MSLMVDLLRDQRIQDVLVDSEVVYIMLNNGTQITIKGVVVVEPKLSDHRVSAAQSATAQRDVSFSSALLGKSARKSANLYGT
jgi:hypothetical protein